MAGASARNGEVHEPETHLIPNVLAAVEGRGELTVYGTDYPTADGTCIRDYIHVEDLARAHLLALEATAPDDARTGDVDGGAVALALNLGNGDGFSVREVLAAAEAATGRPVPHAIGPRRAGDPPALVADAGRAREVLGWEPAHPDLGEIVASAWAWRRAHPARPTAALTAPLAGPAPTPGRRTPPRATEMKRKRPQHGTDPAARLAYRPSIGVVSPAAPAAPPTLPGHQRARTPTR